MYRYLLILVVFCTSSCSPNLLRQPVIYSATVVDYTPYTSKSFFITESNSVSFPYQPPSNLAGVFISRYEVVGARTKTSPSDDMYGSCSSEYTKVKTANKIITATRQGALDELYKKAVEISANGIINLKITAINNFSPTVGKTVSGYEASGMPIKK